MSGIPYIGSKISLISKSEIRYEGILYTIDTKESTVALQNVRSFGTEGRKKDSEKIPPSNEVYDYIIFRGSDIKDLHVCEAPPQQPSHPPLNDSAIIAANTSQHLYNNFTPQFPPNFNNYQASFNPYIPYWPQQPMNQQMPQPQMPQIQTNPNQVPQSQPPPQVQSEVKQEKPPKEEKDSKAPQQTPNQPTTTPQQIPQQTQPRQKENQINYEEVEQQDSERYNRNNRTRGSHFPQRGRGNSNRGRGGHMNRNFNNENSTTKVLDEFDFEGANARFDKGKVYNEIGSTTKEGTDVSELAPQNPSLVPLRYNKSSFFDSISCEATDRVKEGKARASLSEQRKIDSETFGMSVNERGHKSYRIHGKSNRGRGQSTGFQYNHQNNNSINNSGNQPRNQSSTKVFRPVNQNGEKTRGVQKTT